MKKIMTIGLIFLTVILLISDLLCFKPSKTLDFRGTVTEIKHSGDTYTFYIEQTPLSVKYTVLANRKTKILKDDIAISVTEINVGDTLEGNYKKWFAKENQAKYITVYVGSVFFPEPKA